MSDGARVRPLRAEDVGWAVEVLAARRAFLVPHAPLLWRPAEDAAERHATYLAHVLGPGGGRGVRTDDGLVVAVPGDDGWTVDDAWVPPGRWDDEGAALWAALTASLGDGPVAVVSPAPEPKRLRFFLGAGLGLSSSWWHREVTSSAHPSPPGGAAGRAAGVVR